MSEMGVKSGPQLTGNACALRNGDHSDHADVLFARPNIQIYDARIVDLYQWVCARYLVGVKCRNNGEAQLSSALDRISERITLQTLSRLESIRGQHLKTNIYLIFQYDMAEREAVNPY